MSHETTKRDEHGEYHPDAGSPHPVTEENVGYVPCNAVLRHTFDRYGERRYCTAMAIENFTKHDVETDYEHPDFCKNHQSRAALMKQHEENFKTGAYAKSHEHIFQHMPPHKQLLANDLYKSLIDESTYAFDADEVELEIDVSDSDFAPDADALVLQHPVPTEHEVRGKALWFAAVDFITMQSIKEEQFRVSAEETVEGRKLVVGETRSVVATDDDFKEVADEHHLNIQLSRITKDYKEHMKFGGVTYDADDDGSDMQAREWVAVVEPDEESPAPETSSSDMSPMDDIEIPDDAD
jgi:hypothetical protein